MAVLLKKHKENQNAGADILVAGSAIFNKNDRIKITLFD